MRDDEQPPESDEQPPDSTAAVGLGDDPDADAAPTEELRGVLDGAAPGRSRRLGAVDQPAEVRLAVRRKVSFDGDDEATRTIRFIALMAFSSIIATMGVLIDSTATVIGAMLIAPLMTPLMGMALSLVMGWPNRLSRAALLALLGAGIAIGTGWLLAAILPLPVDVTGNSQIASRSSPTIADMLVALAAGGAGAYALSREDVSDSLPGVAIAIALVPPLAVVGVTLNAGEYTASAGTLILFLTNLVSILIVGGITFLTTGIAPLARVAQNQERVKTAVYGTAALALLVVLALFANGRSITRDALNVDTARNVVAAHLDDSFDVVQLTVVDEVIRVVVVGPGDPEDPPALASSLADALGRPVTLDLEWLPRRSTSVEAVPGG